MSSQTHDVPDGERPASRSRRGRSRSGTDTSRWRRAASAVFGAGLVITGLRRRSLRGLVATAAGGWLLYRGLGRPDVRSKVAEMRSETPQRSDSGVPPAALDVERSITIEESAEELYERWREPETHEQLWAHFADVSRPDEDEQHWAVGGPMDVTVEWDAEVTEDEPGEFLRWESLPGATVPNEGSVRFPPRPDREETEVTLHVRFDPPGGSLTTVTADRLDFVPDAVAGQVLDRFKALVETGEIPTTTESNPSGRGSGDLI